MSEDNVDTIKKRFSEHLDPKPLEEASIDDLLDILSPDNPIERIGYRKTANVGHNLEFARVGKNTKGQFSDTKHEELVDDNKMLGFKHLKYSVSESNEFVTVTITKKVAEDVSFWVRTVDDTA